MSTKVRYSRYAHAVVTSLFALGILAQVLLVGLSLLGRRPSWDAHVGLGHSLAGLVLLMIILAYTGRLPRPLKPMTWAVLVIYVLLADVVIFMRQSAPLVAALHPVLAVSLFGVTTFLTVRSWQLARQNAAVAAPATATLQAETSLS